MRGSLVALLAMLAFVPFALFVGRRTSRAAGIAIIVIAGSLFLPEKTAILDVMLIPAIEKERLTYLCALLVMMVYHGEALREARPGRGPEAIFLLVVVAFLGTVAMNRNPMFNYGFRQEPLGFYWVCARSIDDLLTLFLPFMVGRAMFRSRDDLRTLAFVVVAGGLAYVPLMLIEVVMAIPFRVWQLSAMIYKVVAQPSWRWGGLQPVVFMENQLSTASYMAVAVILAAGFGATKTGMRWWRVRRAHFWTSVGLLASRVSSSNVYGIVLGGMLRLFRARLSAVVGLWLVVMVCAYPALRLADVFPDQKLVEFAGEHLNEERARSLNGRFLEEDFIFAGLEDRLWFGWGMFDRIPGAATFGEGEVGLDSYLVIRVGLTGLVGMELLFLLLMIPVWVAWRRLRLLQQKEAQILLAALILCVAARMVDYLMNGLFNSLPFFLAGALYGVAKSIGRPDGGWDAPETPAQVTLFEVPKRKPRGSRRGVAGSSRHRK